jgi:phage-related protein
MAARAFSFNISKPVDGANGTIEKLMFTDLGTKYPDTGAQAGENRTAIITYNFPGGATLAEIKFDRGFSRSRNQRTLTANFGDGYEQRIRDGINHIVDTFGVQLANRRWEEIALVSSFLDNKTPQSFPITLERETFKVVCDSYNVNIGHDDVQSISMELRRVY